MNKIFNKKVYATGIVCCVAVAAIYAGLTYETPNQKPDVAVNPSKNSASSEDFVNQPVVANKNATPKGDTATGNTTIDQEDIAKTTEVDEEEVVSKGEDVAQEEQVQANVNYEDEAVETVADDGADLIWPVTGDIVMDYSTDKAVFDVTLNQYRTNDFVSIGAEVGENVKASGSGTVEFVGVDAERGNMVIIDHGNGWKTTYCQLQDGVSVQEGQSITKGQTIGKVDEATIYSTMLGSHLDFKVTNADELVDPKVALAK